VDCVTHWWQTLQGHGTSEPRRRVGLALGLPGVPLGFPDRDLCLPFRALDLDLECLLDLRGGKAGGS
jgi:hypothetical protein